MTIHRRVAPWSSSPTERPTLKELSRGKDPVAVDIVAVHGLNGDALKTWTAKNGKCWLRDADMLPSKLDNTRILTYSYNATIASLFGGASSDRILQHAHTLITELHADRELEGAVNRPIIFVCHSLGGIIVKRALVYSASRTSQSLEHLHSVFVSTYSILFFGTPHNGSSKANLASTGRRLLDVLIPSKIADSSGQLLEALKIESEVLQNITDLFVPLMKNFKIFFYWEGEKTDLRATRDHIVKEHSAAPILPDTVRAGLPYDHRNMVRFESNSAPGYRMIVATLVRQRKAAPDAIRQRWVAVSEVLERKRLEEAAELLSTTSWRFKGGIVCKSDEVGLEDEKSSEFL